jgi:hypothetical protein
MAEGQEVLRPLLGCLGFVLLGLVGPGLALQRLVRVPLDPAATLPLGAGGAALAYWVSLASGAPWLFPALILALNASLLLGWRRPWRRAPGPSLSGALPSFLALVLVFAVTEYAQNRREPGGAFVSDPLVPEDQTFHAALSFELAHAYPPQVPGLSGFRLAYHLGQPLLRGAALRWAGVHPYDSLSRMDITVWALALILALRGITARLGGSAAAVALVPWTLLATDLSFLFASNPRLEWWTAFAEGNLLFSLLHANSSVPALCLAVACLVALDRHRDGEGAGFLAVAAALALAVPFFKVFLAAQLLLGLGVGFALGRDRLAAALAAVPVAAVVLLMLRGPGAATLTVALDPLLAVRANRQLLGLSPAEGWSLLGWACVWIATSLGLRILGLGSALEALRSGHAAAAAFATIALSGWPLGLLFRVHPTELLQRRTHFNEATYFLEQSGPLLWVFFVLALTAVGLSGIRAVAAGLATAALCLPSSAQFVVHERALPPVRMPPAIVASADALGALGAPLDVVLVKPDPRRYPPPPLVLVGRRVPFTQSIPYLTQFAPRKDVEARLVAVRTFFQTGRPEEAVAIAGSLGARYVCLYGSDRLGFDPAGVLVPVFSRENARIYEIPGAGNP